MAPEQFPGKQAAIAEFVRAMAEYGAGGGKGYRLLGSSPLHCGCRIEAPDSQYLHVVPVNVPSKPKQRWNVQTLVDVIDQALPEDARLLFNQALCRK
jgi:hypothetical protein